MLTLAIETSTSQVGVALAGFDGVLASFHAVSDRRHAEALTPAVAFVCEQAGVVPADIACVAVDIGPGLFTGLRVGLATAKTMAMALDAPMVAMSSLDLLAFGARVSDRRIVTAVDARRGEVFVASYRRVPGGVTAVTNPDVLTPEELVGLVMSFGEDCLLVGDGASRYRAVVTEVVGVEVGDERLRFPSAAVLAELAHAKAVREEFVHPREVEPMYLRGPDAVANFASRQS